MVEFREDYGFVIGIVFIISLTISIVSISVALYSYQTERKVAKEFVETAAQRLNELSNYQKVIIYALYKVDNHTRELPIHDGAIQILEHNMMIQKAATQYAVAGLNNAVFPYFLQPWVVEKLNTDPSLLNSFYKAYQDI